MNEQEQLTKILTLVELTNSRLDQLDRDIRETNKRIEDEVKRWDERFFQLVKEQGQTARTIIIAAASIVVVSPVLGAVVDECQSLYLSTIIVYNISPFDDYMTLEEFQNEVAQTKHELEQY